MGTFTELRQRIPLFITSHKNKENVMLRSRCGSGHNSLITQILIQAQNISKGCEQKSNEICVQNFSDVLQFQR